MLKNLSRKIPQNKHYQNDILYITQPTRNILLTLGAWPSVKNTQSIYTKVYSFFSICIFYILLSCDLIPTVLYWLIQETMRARLQTILFLLYDIISISEYSIFIFRCSQLRRCLKHVEEDWQNVLSVNARNIMLKFAKTGRRLVTICGFFMYSAAFTFRTILPLSQKKIVTDQNITIRPLPCPVYFFSLDVQVSPFYEILFLTQWIAGFVIVSIVTSACGLTAIFVVHICGQLQILICLMKSLVRKHLQKEHEVNKILAKIVKHHIRIRSLLRLVQHTLQEIYLMEIMVNTITICLLVYFLIMDLQDSNIQTFCTYFLSIMNVTIHIFLFCYTGEQLTVQAEEVAIASCELEWYRLPDKKARSIVLLMIMSNTPTKITAGKFVDLSLKTFGDVMKTAGAYFNMLRNITE